MKYNSIFARSFSSRDKKKVGYCGAFVGCSVIAFTICTLLKPYLDPLPLLNLRVSAGAGLKIIMTDQETSQLHQIDIQTKEIKPICDTSEPSSDICEMTGDIRIHGNSSTVFVIMNTTTATTSNKNTTSWRIRPYARKGDKTAMGVIQEFTIKLIAAAAATSNQLQEIPTCTHHHSVPGLVFSTSGFVGNLFHDFTDVLIPLFLTSREFDGQVKFLVTNKQSWWINKYKQVLRKLSNYEVIDIDREPGVHCFPRMVVGLKKHKEFSIEPLRSPYSMKDLREFLRGAYSLQRGVITDGAAGKRPRLLIISRKRTRLLLNEGEIVAMATGLGFEVVSTDANVNTNLTRFANLVNSCDVMMGVHGAGLTNMVFLPENAIVIQILPLGGMESLARIDFCEPAQDMNLRYLEYQIGEEESSLRQEYPAGHQVFTDPDSIKKKGWHPFRVVYLDKQNVRLDVGRFRATLLEALNPLH